MAAMASQTTPVGAVQELLNKSFEAATRSLPAKDDTLRDAKNAEVVSTQVPEVEQILGRMVGQMESALHTLLLAVRVSQNASAV